MFIVCHDATLDKTSKHRVGYDTEEETTDEARSIADWMILDVGMLKVKCLTYGLVSTG